jgi:hypothetical protein
VTAFVLIALGGALMLAAMALRSFPLPRLLVVGVGLLGVVTTAVGAFRL